MKKLRQKAYRDFSKGNWCSVQASKVPENSTNPSINLDSDVEFGSLVSRLGTTLINAQIIDNKPVLGLHNFRDSVGSGSKLFAVVSDGTNNDIYDALTGAKSLEDDTKDLKTRFLTYLDSCLRLNGTDGAKAWNGSAWVTTGGTFDLANLPSGSKYAIEFKDRVYVAGSTSSPDRVDVSGIASATARTVSWTVGNKYIVFEQEDGGGGITGLSKVPGYILVFKKRTMKRYDGSSAYPEDMVNQGAPSQEAIVTAGGMCFFINENGAWATTGGMPQKISEFSVDDIITSCSAANLVNVASGTDEKHVFWSFASVTIQGETYTNVTLKYNISQNTWDIRKYPTLQRVFAKYVDSDGAVFLTFGDDDGNVQKLDVGNTDNGTGISYSMETQDWEFGLRMFQKGINRFVVLTENVSKGALMWRNSHNAEDWKPVGNISQEIQEFANIDIRGNFFQFKITETTTTGQAKILGFEFPEGINVFESTK
jgi:hypothetical protein